MKVAKACIAAMPPSAELVGDKGYDSNDLRAWLAERGTIAVIPGEALHEWIRCSLVSAVLGPPCRGWLFGQTRRRGRRHAYERTGHAHWSWSGAGAAR